MNKLNLNQLEIINGGDAIQDGLNFASGVCAAYSVGVILDWFTPVGWASKSCLVIWAANALY